MTSKKTSRPESGCTFIAFDAFGPVCTNPDKRSPRYCPFAKDERHECRWLKAFEEWKKKGGHA